MNEPKPEKTTTKKAGARLQHVVVHETEDDRPGFDDIVVFGQEIDALRHIIGQTNWRYVAVAHGQSVAEALKAAGS